MEARELKDKASAFFTKGRFAKAAEAYEEFCTMDRKDHQARLRCGDAWNKAGKKDKAIIAYSMAAEGFAKDGFLPRAIAASKLVLEIDPAHKGVQKMLAELYAQKSGGSRGSKAAAAPAPEMEIQRGVSAPTTSSFANNKAAIDIDAPIAKPKHAGFKPTKTEAPSPLDRADALELPEYEIPMEDAASSMAVLQAKKGPNPNRRADAIEIDVDDGPAGGPKELVETSIDIDMGSGQPVSGEVEIPIEGQPLPDELPIVVDQLPPELQVAAQLAPPPPPPASFELNVEVSLQPPPPPAGAVYDLTVEVPAPPAEPPPPRSSGVYELTEALPEPRPSVPVFELTDEADAPTPAPPPEPPPVDLGAPRAKPPPPDPAPEPPPLELVVRKAAPPPLPSPEPVVQPPPPPPEQVAPKSVAPQPVAPQPVALQPVAPQPVASQPVPQQPAPPPPEPEPVAPKPPSPPPAPAHATGSPAARNPPAPVHVEAPRAVAPRSHLPPSVGDAASAPPSIRPMAAAEASQPPGLKPRRVDHAPPAASPPSVPVSSPSSSRIWLPPTFTPAAAHAEGETRTAPAPVVPVTPPAEPSTDLERSLQAFMQFDPDAPTPAEPPRAAAPEPVPEAAAPAPPAATRQSFTELDLDEGDSLLHAVEAAANVPASAEPVEEAMDAPDDHRAEPGGLPKIPLFSDLPEDAFIELFERCPLQRFEEGQLVFEQGDKADAFFVICGGQVRVFRTDDDVRKDLATLEEGSFFGEMALLSEAPRSASVEAAAEDTQVLVISAEILKELSAKHPVVSTALKKFCRQRMLSNLMNQAAIFAPFNRNDRRELVQKFRARDVNKGDVLVKEGASSDGLYVVLSGEVEVEAKGHRIASLKEGQVFGEMSLLMRSPASATVRAVRHTSLLRLPKHDFDMLILSHPQVLEHVSTLIDERKKSDLSRKKNDAHELV